MENKLQQNAFLLFSSPWQRLPFFSNLPQGLITGLLEDSIFKQTKNKEMIFKQNEPAEAFGFVVEGLVRLYRFNPKGQRVVMDFVGPGGMIGGLLMAQTEITYPVTAQSIGPGQFLKIPKATYLKHWMNHPEVIRRTQNANLERMQAIHSTRELQKYPLEEKLAQILLTMGSPMESIIEMRVSKTDLADMVGACVESVIRIFSAWEKNGWLKRADHGYEKIDKIKLQERIAV
jgi:CRP-like cAMP-binding protein